MTVEFRLLGDVEFRVEDRVVDLGHARQRCVLVALIADAERAVPVDVLVDRVWGDRPPQRARGAVYNYLSRLRQVLAVTSDLRVARRAGGYVLTGDPLAVGLHRFRQVIAQ